MKEKTNFVKTNKKGQISRTLSSQVSGRQLAETQWDERSVINLTGFWSWLHHFTSVVSGSHLNVWQCWCLLWSLPRFHAWVYGWLIVQCLWYLQVCSWSDPAQIPVWAVFFQRQYCTVAFTVWAKIHYRSDFIVHESTVENTVAINLNI